MRMKPVASLAVAAALTIGAFGSPSGWAGLHLKHKDPRQPAAPAAQSETKAGVKGNIAPATDTDNPLGELRSFDVMDIERHDFSASRENVPAEILEYARTALQNDDRLRYGSPGQGLLRFSCVDNGCSHIRAEVTQGLNGPVVWQTEEEFEPGFLVNVHFLPDSRHFAKRIVGKLALDYQKALKPLPMKINIKDE